ncbi:hypothetical protein CDAR_31681 [Caerostris darwini]|uniref:Uncharacterized protein n=1 Tax=Caerostris darwini TaxID=1538125 RepID=A0AAV4NQS8_9ARAC|nr:hypothetical protein CDAR_31681 [Caerostris darwini]
MKRCLLIERRPPPIAPDERDAHWPGKILPQLPLLPMAPTHQYRLYHGARNFSSLTPTLVLTVRQQSCFRFLQPALCSFLSLKSCKTAAIDRHQDLW